MGIESDQLVYDYLSRVGDLAQATTLTAAERARLVTGQHAKRQATWFRHHALADAGRLHTIHARFTGLTQLSECQRGDLLNFIETPT